MSLLKKISQEMILNVVIRGTIPDKKPGDVYWRVLVLDRSSSKIVSNSCSMQDITAAGITIVEDLHKKREPLPFLEAIYVLKPTDDSMVCLFRDLNSNPPLYKAFHVFFIEMCDVETFDNLCEVVNISRIKTLKEINMSFIPFESHVFTLEENDLIDRLYFNQSASDSSTKAIERLAGQIATLCACLGENPGIRYRSAYRKNSELAQAVEEKLQAYKTVEHTMGEGAHKARSQLIILDRGFDCTTPVLHELTFEAMVHDLLSIDDNSYKLKGTSGDEKEVFLDDNEQSWKKLKHMHIAEVSQNVSEEYKTFIESKNVSTKGEVGIKDLQLMLKKLPQYQKELTMFNTYINMAGDCMNAFQRIEKLCAVEQDLATGLDSEGERIKDFMNQMNPILLDIDRNTGFNDHEKLRIIMLYIMCKNGIPEDSLTKLLSHANIEPGLKQIVTNLSLLGPNVIVNGGVRKEIPQLERKDREDEGTRYKLSRWIPILKDIIEFTMEDRLDQKHFPYKSNRAAEIGYKVPTSTRYGHWYTKPGNQERSVPRLIIFVVGGITYSEIRSVYEVNKSQGEWEVIIGSTKVLTPDNFLKSLEAMSM